MFPISFLFEHCKKSVKTLDIAKQKNLKMCISSKRNVTNGKESRPHLKPYYILDLEKARNVSLKD